MKTALLGIILLGSVLAAIGASFGQSPQEKSPVDIERDAIVVEFLKLQAERATAQAAADDSIRSKHIAALQALYKRANAIQDSEMPIAIHTELNRFGIRIPEEFSLRINDDETVKPRTLVDAKTHVIYYLESDGRHVTAIAPDGKILWQRDPFIDAKLKPYRLTKPVIVYFEFLKSDLKAEKIAINFNSSQFGVIDPATGDFEWHGQN